MDIQRSLSLRLGGLEAVFNTIHFFEFYYFICKIYLETKINDKDLDKGGKCLTLFCILIFIT